MSAGERFEVIPYRAEALPQVIAVWNAALGESFRLREALFVQNTLRDPHFDPAGCWVARAPVEGAVIGVGLAKVAREPLGADGLLPDRGWVSALVVHPAWQRRRIGRRLLAAAESYLAAHGRRRVLLGSDPGHFFPGVPGTGPALAFFAGAGYRLEGDAYDLHRRIGEYTTPLAVAAAVAAHPQLEIRPLRAGEESRLLAFLGDAFPGRWRYTMDRALTAGMPIRDVMGVVRAGAVSGFAQLFHPASRWIGPSIAWPLDRAARAGGLGPMGLAPALRGRGLGLALVDRAILHLRALGIEEMIIDWTGLTEFYGRLGFVPLRHYRHGEKTLQVEEA
ncbi:MAG TPA: GNAT family N-acetyltransferase [bacterium]|nr:GNAT family N-acetyltransferase [bacterium]